MRTILYVALGGALGATLRYATGLLVARYWSTSLPLPTWTPNLLGCLLIGILVPLFTQGDVDEVWSFFFVTGLLGSYTTFSTFSMDTFLLWQEGLIWHALANVGGSVVLGLLFAAWGYRIGSGLL